MATGGSQTSDTHPTDLHYVRLEGNDFFPEIFWTLFSNNPARDESGEQNAYVCALTMPDPSHLEKTVLIAGVDSIGQPLRKRTDQLRRENYFNEDHGIDGHNFFYPQSGSNAANIRNLVSAGADM